MLDLDFDSILHISYVPLSKVLALCEFLKNYLFILGCTGSVGVHGFSPVVASGGYVPVVVCRLYVPVVVCRLPLLRSMALGHVGFSNCGP